jgi:hypothetical protein
MLPESMIERYRKHRKKKAIEVSLKSTAEKHELLSGMQPGDAFSRIYQDRMWGGEGRQFYSGLGSHSPMIVDPYVLAMRGFVNKYFSSAPDAVDLGCGDFNVGRQIRSLFHSYVGCDAVPSLIERNKAEFSGLGAEFVCLDMTVDEFPVGDVAMIRQVLQHLSNAQITRVLPKLYAYSWVVVTEHLPSEEFLPNVDKPIGPDVRAMSKEPSGIVLTQPPFSLAVKDEVILCEVSDADFGGVIRTSAYKL